MERVVIIPALNPDDRLRDIVDRNWKLENQVILVDDGSDQKYRAFFHELEEKCILLRHDRNLGKGAAIKTALKFIKKEIWDCRVIGVMDADGQHLADDMERLLMKAASKADALILGSRTIDRKVPRKSRVGNLITRKVFQMETGTRVSDTQTGLRAFSSRLLEVMLDIPGERYEYEMNVLVTCAKRNIPIVEVPIRTIYHDKDNSCSHFRKVRDSIRIYRELLKFSFVSFSSFLLDYVLFMILTVLLPGTAWGILAANIAARLLSGTYNYTFNCRIVFRRKQTAKTAADYFLLAVGILVLNNILLQGFTQGLRIPVYLAKILTETCLFVTSWLVQKKWIFRKRNLVRHSAMRKKALAFTADVLAAAILLGGIYGVNYLIPQKGVSAQVMTAKASGSSQVKAGDPESTEETNRTAETVETTETAASTSSQERATFLQDIIDSNPSGLPTTHVSLDAQDWHQKFADKFTDQVVSTDTSYTSPDLSIHLTYDSYKTNKLDKSENGNHEKYGTDISYVLADIYVGDITCLQTAFAQNTYCVGYSEKLSDMSARMKSVLAVNGYGNLRPELGRHHADL